MMHRRHLLRLSAAWLLVPGLVGRAAVAQAWPRRAVRLIVPFAPGGSTDAVARIVANRLSEVWGQQMVVENRGGGASNIGHQEVVRSEADGHTVLIASMPLAVNRFLFPSLGYDPVADLAPVTLICTYPNVMTVPNTSPAKSVREFIDHAKANRLTFASSGNGTSVHLSGELFKRMAGIEMTHVPYRGGGPAVNDLIPGRVDVMFNTIGTALPLVRGGQLRGLAVTTAERFFTAPDMPTVAESGVPGFDVSSWFAFFVPARTPRSVVDRIQADTAAVLAEPAIKDRIQNLGIRVASSTPEQLAVHLKSEMDKWGPVIKSAGITARE
jgi:tripartite-type tricarboxylate transporter receptor subunit TctC